MKDVSKPLPGVFKSSQDISLEALCARPTCVHPLWWHLWCSIRVKNRWEIGVCHSDSSDCQCIGFMVIADPEKIRV